jgi:multimeric flavodoxin WrbA
MDGNLVLILKGSPRIKGNSALLAERVAAGAREAGAEVESFDLHGMNLRPCDGCDACQGSVDAGCVIEDDMQLLYPKIREARSIVLASPVYWFTMSAQLKLCIDRWYAFVGPEGTVLKGKQFGLVLTYGDTDPYSSGAVNAIRTFQDMCRFLRAPILGVVYGSAMGAGEIESQPALLEEAYRLGQRLGAQA